MAQSDSNKRSYDPLVFWVSAAGVAVFLLWGILFPKSMGAGVSAVFGWTTDYWGWLYLLTAFLLVGACFVLMGAKYGTMKLGLAGDTPDFSTFSWFGMLFGSAIAAGIVFRSPAATCAPSGALPWRRWPPLLAGTGGLKAIQAASIARAFPLMFLLLWILYGTFKGLNAYQRETRK